MTIHPPTLTDLQKVAQWREDARSALRTPYMVSGHQQEKYFAQIQDMHRYRIWSFRVMRDEVFPLVAVGGLQDIQWENGLAEISLIVNPDQRGRGFGSQAVDIILREAFDNMRLETVWGECYLTGIEKFWLDRLEAYEGETQVLYLNWRKRWNGQSYSSLYFAFHDG